MTPLYSRPGMKEPGGVAPYKPEEEREGMRGRRHACKVGLEKGQGRQVRFRR